jgi:Glyoxalase superfamily protein
MTDLSNVPSTDALKQQAKRLRQQLHNSGVAVGHSAALELVAQQYGTRDWNTLQALAGNRVQLRVGDHVRGRYLGQAFTGEVRGLCVLGDGESRQITLHFDVPVDVVRFESFSSLRQRVQGVIGWDGCSARKTSDGVPQLIVEGLVQT